MKQMAVTAVRGTVGRVGIAFGLMLLASVPVSAQEKGTTVETKIDWQAFLGRHDLVWQKMPKTWYEAPFLGNGMMGTMIRQTGDRVMRFDVGRGDVQNHRRGSDIYGISRLPIGHFELRTVGDIQGGHIQLDLWNAEARGMIRTTRGAIEWRAFVHSDHMAILVETEPRQGERDCRWQWNPEKAVCPRHLRKPRKGYQHNPPFTERQDGDVRITVQPLLEGGETVTAWHAAQEGDRTRLTVSVAHSFPERQAEREAVEVLTRVRGISLDALTKSHREWWHAYYPKSFVSIPDAYWESFYWIQMYKLASATRGDRMLLDLQGPWPQPTPWPGCWWNLNIQLTYWPTNGANRLEIGDSLCRTMYDNVDNLIANVPEQYRSDSAGVGRVTGQHCVSSQVRPPGSDRAECGNLLWACHNCWLHYRHEMDHARLRAHLFPLLKRAVAFYLHFLNRGEDGKLHLPTTYSPEYNFAEGPDCNYDLALLRWGCETLLGICERLGIDDPEAPRWKEVLDDLVDYPTDQNGYMIADGVPFARGHRHYSHLLMLYPLYLVNREQEGATELAIRSVDHWHKLTPKGTGYTKTGASSIFSAFGLGNRALEKLNGMKGYIRPNTMYKEAGPVIETPLSGAQSIHDMIIQSWGRPPSQGNYGATSVIRVFPAAPDAWPDIAFHDLRTEGAFLVSAVRSERKTRFVRIKSLAGEPCVVIPGLEGPVRVSGTRASALKEIAPGRFALDLERGEEAVLWTGNTMPGLAIQAVPARSGSANSFGMK